MEINSEMMAVLHSLAGREITAPHALVSFGDGNQFGEISIGSVAGGDIIKLTFNTGGGDYAEGYIEKRQGVIVSGEGRVQGPAIGLNQGTISGTYIYDPPVEDADVKSNSIPRLPAPVTLFGLSLLLFAFGTVVVSYLVPVHRLVYTAYPAQPPSPLSNPTIWAIFGGSLIAAWLGARQKGAVRRGLAVLVVVVITLFGLVLLFTPAVTSAAPIAQAASPVPSPGSTTATPAAAPTPTVGILPPPYALQVTVDGPDAVRYGSSATISAEAQVLTNTLAAPDISLMASEGYTATVLAQIPNFEVNEAVAGQREERPLALQKPAIWTWAIAPIEGRLGDQTLVFDLLLTEPDGRQQPLPRRLLTISITNVLGLTAVQVAILAGIGGFIGALGILPMLLEHFLKAREAKKAAQPQEMPQPNYTLAQRSGGLSSGQLAEQDRQSMIAAPGIMPTSGQPALGASKKATLRPQSEGSSLREATATTPPPNAQAVQEGVQTPPPDTP